VLEREDRAIPIEAEIVASWGSDKSVLVSIVCTTFNHAAYIEDAIRGFLRQKTTFPYEIIIHDDASTDGTQETIKHYSRDYPNLIKPILQVENQFSKGGFRPAAFAAQHATGKYIALCEGDDYWVDEEKLLKQCAVLEKYSDIGLCVHNAHTVGMDGDRSNYTFPSWAETEGAIDYANIFTARGQFAPTASMFMRREVITLLPDFFYQAPIGDFFLEVYSGRNGVYYFPGKMSVYRRGLPGGWSSTTLNDFEKRIGFNQSLLRSLRELRVELGAIDGRFVKYKEQQVHFDLADVYLDKNEKWLAFKVWIRCFHGAPLLGRHFTIFRRLLR
jgi:glycosyltransferase involved in cell wall biosynthesis